MGVAAILLDVALYFFYTARRLDRLHARIDAAGAALDAQLRKRCVAATLLSEELPEPSALRVTGAVLATLEVHGLAHDREVAENLLSRELARLADERPAVFLAPSATAVDVHDDALRASIARRFYNDTVRDALVVRDRRTVRWLGLAGRAPHPAYFEMDDEELPTPSNSVAKRPRVEV